MANMIVSGAGTTAVNGTYVENGTMNGKPKYTFGSYIIYYAGDYTYVPSDPPDRAGWTIYGDGSGWYVTPDDTATPDLATWQVGLLSGAAPAPTVTAAPSGTTHEGEATLSSLSYLRTKKS